MAQATEAMFLHGNDQGVMQHTPATAMSLGEIRKFGADAVFGQAFVCNVVGGLAAAELGAVCTKGVWKIKKAVSGGVTFALGARVFWDASANTAIAASGGADDFILGACIEVAAADADDHVRVELNGQGLNT
jgi:hypothetical protein